VENGTIIVKFDGLIEEVGPADLMAQKYKDATFAMDLDGTGKSVVPGLVDGHTHPVWAGDRCHEFAAKLAGATYMDIHKMGGGISFSVRHTKEASEEELTRLLQERLKRMSKFGTTLAEAKTGYGLEKETELKMLRVLTKEARSVSCGVDLVSNYLVHSIPKGQTSTDATKDVLENQLPALGEAMKDGSVDCELVDVFCDKGIFEIEDTRKILEAGVALGLSINFHGDELHPIKASELAGELGALACSHLEMVSDEGIAALGKRPTVAVLLPTTAYVLRLHPPPARKMIEAGVPVALGSDFNPNAHCLSMPMTMNLACILLRLTMPEALVAATINAAHSMNRSATHGSLEHGKAGDLLLLNCPSWEHLIYEIADPPIQHVFKGGSLLQS
jgi:imidazolonepropionase